MYLDEYKRNATTIYAIVVKCLEVGRTVRVGQRKWSEFAAVRKYCTNDVPNGSVRARTSTAIIGRKQTLVDPSIDNWSLLLSFVRPKLGEYYTNRVKTKRADKRR